MLLLELIPHDKFHCFSCHLLKYQKKHFSVSLNAKMVEDVQPKDDPRSQKEMYPFLYG